ncbi:TetR/AcrR family transcriptional regulator [Nocardioides speluncae]|uniref:TetR/AcrR family transcriptional regulator n=1 Tax=Nocardioides speluncae TaxID=2670337 RepID=UPI00137AF72B|nr:TetR family transcriptional regulator [Nocardioides speluncae]
MPRGVAIPELRENLFAAAERLLLRDGPSALSSRAITTEAACAKGVLHNHFTDLDGFLAAFAVEQFRRAHGDVAQLHCLVGRATVVDNLRAASTTLLGSPLLAVHSVIALRPTLAQRLRESGGHRSPNLGDIERVIAAYLEDEKKLGRITPEADTAAIALALVGTIHRVLMSDHGDSTEACEAVTRVLDLLLLGLTATTEASGEQEGRPR